jgi:hypothetical protein
VGKVKNLSQLHGHVGEKTRTVRLSSIPTLQVEE